MDERGGNISFLENITLNGTNLLYQDRNIAINGTISVGNASTLRFRNCTIVMNASAGSMSDIDVGPGSSLILESVALGAMGTGNAYNITCQGFLSVSDSSVEGFNNMSLVNASAVLRSSSIITAGSGAYFLNSEADLYNTTMDPGNSCIRGGSQVRQWEYLLVEVTSWYLGSVEVASVSVSNATDEVVSTGRSGADGTVPLLTIGTTIHGTGEKIDMGPFVINVTHPKYHGNETVIDIRAETFLSISLDPVLGHIVGRITIEDGSGVAGAEVTNSVVSTLSGPDGLYNLSVFARTTYTISVRRRNHTGESRPGIYVAPGRTLVTNFTLKEDPVPFTLDFLSRSIYRVHRLGPYPIRFNSRLDPDTLDTSTLRLEKENGGKNLPVSCALQLDEGGLIARLMPESELDSFAWYELTVGEGIRSWDGRSILWRDFSYRFKTDYDPLVSTVPGIGEKNVSRGSTVILELRISVDRDTVHEGSVLMTGPGGKRIGGVVTLAGNTVVFKANGSLDFSSDYSITVTEALLDADGQSVFPGGMLFNFSTRENPFRTILHINVSTMEGAGIPQGSDPVLHVRGLDDAHNFTVPIPWNGVLELDNLTAGNHSLTLRANGFKNLTVNLTLNSDGREYLDMELIEADTPDPDENGDGMTDMGTLLVIIIIMAMFLFSILLMGLRRADRVVKRRREGIQRTGAPGMDSFQCKVAPNLEAVSKTMEARGLSIEGCKNDGEKGNVDGKSGEADGGE